MPPRPRSQHGTGLEPDTSHLAVNVRETQSCSNNTPPSILQKQDSSLPLNRSSDTAEDTVWIFGYGSLCWKPDFEYLNRLTGYVRGYSRKFWQGNTAHRGTPDKPGRVATLIEEKNGEVWGVGYEVPRNSPVLDYLWERECLLGGYHLIEVTFYPVGRNGMKGLAYLATPSSPGWLGCASIEDTALQIAEAIGPAGTNSEYVCRLAAWIRSNTPVRDPHLDLLDLLIKSATEPTNLIGSGLITARDKIRATIKRLNVSKRHYRYNEYLTISRTQA